MFLCLGATTNIMAQTRTIGLIQSDPRSYQGFTLFGPMSYNVSYLVDNEGRMVHSWPGTYNPGLALYLMQNGQLIRTGIRDQSRAGSGGVIEAVDWDGTVLWSVLDTSNRYEFHHDICELPNGHILVIAWETKSKQEAIAAGRDPQYFNLDIFLPDAILEFAPNGQGSADIVWEWHFWDHMSTNLPGSWTANGRPVSSDITDPGKIDINFLTNGQADWLHCNSVAYNPVLDQIAISCHNTNELVVISHSTANYANPFVGIEAARGKAGDFLYRWGNPASYGAGIKTDQKLFGQHDVQWISEPLPGAGHILIFNNGLQRPDGQYSTVLEIDPGVLSNGTYPRDEGKAFGPDSVYWMYKAPNPRDFFSNNISGAQRLPNGNTLICQGKNGLLFEVTANGETVWKYVNPVNAQGPREQGTAIVNNMVFKTRRYAADYPGLIGKDLTPGNTIETYKTDVQTQGAVSPCFGLTVFPNPSSGNATARVQLPYSTALSLVIYDIFGRSVWREQYTTRRSGTHSFSFSTSAFTPGRYFIQLLSTKGMRVAPFSVVR